MESFEVKETEAITNETFKIARVNSSQFEL